MALVIVLHPNNSDVTLEKLSLEICSLIYRAIETKIVIAKDLNCKFPPTGVKLLAGPSNGCLHYTASLTGLMICFELTAPIKVIKSN